MVSIAFLCEQLVFPAFIQTCIEHYHVFQIDSMWAGRYQPLPMTQVLTKKNYTDHVPANDEEVGGLDFGSEHLAYQQRGGNARPAYIL